MTQAVAQLRLDGACNPGDSEIEPAFEKHFYHPLKDGLYRAAGRMRTLQAGSIHAYLAYIFVTLIALLLFGVRG